MAWLRKALRHPPCRAVRITPLRCRPVAALVRRARPQQPRPHRAATRAASAGLVRHRRRAVLGGSTRDRHHPAGLAAGEQGGDHCRSDLMNVRPRS